MSLLHQLFDQLGPTGQWLLRASWQAGVLAILVLALQWILGSRLSARLRYNLWLLVVLRLLLPAVPASPLSVHNLLALSKTQPPQSSVEPVDLKVEVLAETPQPIDQPQQPRPTAATPIQPIGNWKDRSLSIASGLYLAIALLLLTRTLFATAKLRSQSRRFKPITDPDVLQLLDEARHRLHIRRRITLLEAPSLSTPALMGLLHPRILLPTRVLADFDPPELRLIFLHELAHLRRHDVAINWLITLLQTIHWFNPLIWLAFARLRAERELACDELVLSASQHNERRQYGNTMIKLLAAFSAGRALPGAVGILEGQAPIRRRITMIAQFENRRPRTWMAVLLAAILAMICLTDGASAQQRQPSPRGGRGGEGGTARTPSGPGGDAAVQPAPPRFAPGQEDNAEAATAQTRTALKRKIPEVNFQNVAMKDAIDFLKDLTGLNIYVDWKAMEAAAIPQDSPVSLRLKDVPASEVLRLVLREASPILRYDIESGIIVISPNAAKPLAIIKAYTIDDAVADHPESRRSIQRLEEQVKLTTDENQRQRFQEQVENMQMAAEGRKQRRLLELVELIQTTVAPYTSGMAVRAFDDKLIVTADESGHNEVARVLQMIGQKAAAADKPANPIKDATGKTGGF